MSTQPTDDELESFAYAFDWEGWIAPALAKRAFARAVLAKWSAPAAGGEPVAWIRFQPPYRPDVLAQRHRPTLDGEPDTQYRPLVFGDTSPQPLREPLTLEQMDAALGSAKKVKPGYVGWVTDQRREWGRAVERAHGIQGGQHGTE